MGEHTPTPWMTQPCGELLPDDVMIVADRGKTKDGIQIISTVARALSIRQTPEGTAANAAFIVMAVNSHDALVKALEFIVEMNRQHANDQYGDADKAESWACVRVARDALSTVVEGSREP